MLLSLFERETLDATLTRYTFLAGKFISGFSGQIVAATDWFSFFVYASFMGLPAVFLAVVVARRMASEKRHVT